MPRITSAGSTIFTVPLPGGGKAATSHKSISHAKKTLKAMTSPDGNSSAIIHMMQDNAQQWINDMLSGHLHHWNVWFLLKVQCWPRVRYRLCSLTASFQDLDRALHRQYYQILPLRTPYKHHINMADRLPLAELSIQNEQLTPPTEMIQPIKTKKTHPLKPPKLTHPYSLDLLSSPRDKWSAMTHSL